MATKPQAGKRFGAIRPFVEPGPAWAVVADYNYRQAAQDV